MLNNDYILRSDIQKAIGDWFLNDGDKRSMMQVFQDIPAADVEPKQRWIPATIPPEKNGRYLCYYMDEEFGGCIDFGRYTDGEWYVSGVKYYMPLPDKPEGIDDTVWTVAAKIRISQPGGITGFQKGFSCANCNTFFAGDAPPDRCPKCGRRVIKATKGEDDA